MRKSILNKTFYILATCLLIAAATPSFSSAQTTTPDDTTTFKFWYSAFDARSMAMANATIADPLSNHGLYSNPGLLPFHSDLPDLTLNSVYSAQYNVLLENLSGSLINEEDRKLLVGTTLLHNGPSRIPLQQNRRLRFTQLNFDLAYGQKLTPSFSMGLKLNANYGQTETGSSIVTNSSLGFMYVPSSVVSYGLVYKGTGYQNEWLGSGLSYHRANNENTTQIQSTELPQRLELGITMRFPALQKHPDFVLSFSNEKLFGQSGLVYRAGLEIFLVEQLSVRGGYFHAPFVTGGRMGVGLSIDPLDINYAYTHNNLDLNGRAHLLSITVDI